MASLDVICIGAINYDYMFHCTGLDLWRHPPVEATRT